MMRRRLWARRVLQLLFLSLSLLAGFATQDSNLRIKHDQRMPTVQGALQRRQIPLTISNEGQEEDERVVDPPLARACKISVEKGAGVGYSQQSGLRGQVCPSATGRTPRWVSGEEEIT